MAETICKYYEHALIDENNKIILDALKKKYKHGKMHINRISRQRDQH